MPSNPGRKEFVIFHPPKMNNWYYPFGDTMYIKSMAIGLLAIAEYLERNGISSEIIHLGSEFITDPKFDPAEYVNKTRPAVVGISLHWHYQSYDAIELAKYIKSKNPDVFLLMGGLTASFFAEEIIKEFNYIDGIIRGDAEIPALTLIQVLNSENPDLSLVPNLIWRKGKSIISNQISYVADEKMLDDLEFMDFRLLNKFDFYINVFGRSTSNYIKMLPPSFNMFRRSAPSIVMPVARGCSANCKWCGGARYAHSLSSGRKRYVFRSPKRIIDDMKKASDYGIYNFHFAHYSHPREADYYIELFSEVRKAKVKGGAYFECSALPTKELVDAFKETYGNYEYSCLCLSRMAPNEEVRKLNVGNYYSNQELFDILAYIDHKEIPVELTFTLGMPGEKIGDVEKLRKFRREILASLRNVRSAAVLTSQLEPGSFWYLEPERFNIQTDRKTFHDFYDFHSDPYTSYFSHLGYLIKEYCQDQEYTVRWFEKKLLKIRCKYFCLLASNSHGTLKNKIGNIKCVLARIIWKVMAVFYKKNPTWHN